MKNWSKKDWEKFEKLITVCHKLFAQSNAQVDHNVKLRGASGVDHQIDVLVKEYSLYTPLIIISCKFESKKVGIRHAKEWSSVVADVGAAKGVIVSKAGFSPRAITYAKDLRNRLELWQIQELTESDFDGYIQKVMIEATMWVPTVPKNSVIFQGQTTDPSLPKQKIPINFSARNRDELYLRDDKDQLCENLWDEFVKFYYRNVNPDQHIYKFDFTPSQSRFIVIQGRKFNFKRFYCEIHEEPYRFQVDFDVLEYFKLQYKNAITGETRLIPIGLVEYFERQHGSS
jgi:hypothetical protein